MSTEVPAGLAERGHRLWSETLIAKPNLNPGERVLLEEACRLADRLDRLAGLLDGDEESWGRIRWRDDGDGSLIIDSAMAEARQATAELRQVVKALNLGTGEGVAGKPAGRMGQLLELHHGSA